MVPSLQQERRAAVLSTAYRVGIYYLVAGVLWILLSDTALAALVRDSDLLSRFQTFKGWAFVTVSAGLIWWLVRREVRRVQRSEARLAALAEQSIAGMYVVVAGRPVQVNRRFAEIFGYSVEGVGHVRAATLVAAEDRERAGPIMGSGGLLEEGAHARFKGVRASGELIDLEAFGRPIDWDGVPGVAGLVLDVSERVQLEEKLRQAARLDALGNLTGAVAHDFNNFLTGIIGNLDLMLSDRGTDSHELQTNLELVRDSAARAAALTGQLLTFSRGRIFHHRPIDPNRHLRKLSSFLDSLCQGGQRLELDLATSIPPVVLDPVALDQLVVNLFVNAKDAVGGRGTITVRTRVRQRPGSPAEVHIEISDDGVGMPREVRERIFEPFFTTKERGTGLGLATVRSIVDEIHGHLSVESEAGKGTTVRVSVAASDTLPADPTGTATVIPFSPTVRTASILVVDDDAAVRKVVAAALKRVGHKVLVASGATDATRTLQGIRGEIDLIVCDVHLSDISGPELVLEIRQEYPELRVLFMSGSRRPESPELAAVLRTAPFLDKPFSLDQLRDAVDRAIWGEPQQPQIESSGV